MTTITFPQDHWFENVEQRSHPWPGLAWITAQLTVPDVPQAIKLYGEIFGLVCIFQHVYPDGAIPFARLRYRGNNLTLCEEGRFGLETKAPVSSQTIPPFILYLYVDDVDAMYTRVLSKGCKTVTEPRLESWGDQIARIADPLGYIWELAKRDTD